MKIAITSTGNSLDSKVDSRFGRCSFFAIHNTITKETKFIANSSKEAEGGAGPAAVQQVASENIEKVVSGEFGVKIKPLFESLNVQMIVMNEDITIQEVIDLLDSNSNAPKKTKIAIPTENGILCAHFGHCEQFYFAEVENNKIINETFITPPAHEPGLYPAWVKQQGAAIVISGGMGQKARDLFAQQNIETLVGAQQKKPTELVNDYLNKKLITGSNSCNH